MSDWADKVASYLCGYSSRDVMEPQIAANLRKAKADGMRLVARQVISGEEAAGLLRLADKIEKGET